MVKLETQPAIYLIAPRPAPTSRSVIRPQRLRQHHRVPPVGLHPVADPRLREGRLLRGISAGAANSRRCPSRASSRCTR